MRLFKNVFLDFVAAGSSNGSVFEQWELASKARPRFGRNWWYWLPDFSTNGGKFKSDECTDINFSWFCFCFSLTVFPWRCK